MQTTLHRKDNDFAIETTAENEDEFRQQFVRALNQVLVDGTYASDEVFVMDEWIKLASEITCTFRGYKSQVVVRKQIIAGHLAPDAEQVAVSRSLDQGTNGKGDAAKVPLPA